jgi:hypothetical protein
MQDDNEVTDATITMRNRSFIFFMKFVFYVM